MEPSSRPLGARGRLTRVGVIDGQPLFRDAVCRVIRQRPQLQLAAEAGDARQALALIRDVRPDVALVDPGLEALDGERLLKLSAAERLGTRFILVAGQMDSMRAYELLALGAAGCLLRNATADELGRAIVAVAAGRTFLTGDVQHAVVDEIRVRAHDRRPVLSPREHEVLRRIAAGHSTPAISEGMHLSVSTVKTHLAHLYDKLDVSDRAAAVAAAMRRGLIE